MAEQTLVSVEQRTAEDLLEQLDRLMMKQADAGGLWAKSAKERADEAVRRVEAVRREAKR